MEQLAGLSATAWAAIAAWVTLVVLTTTAILGWRQLREAVRLRQEQSRPWVVVDFDTPNAWLIDLTIQNVGKTTAKDVRLEFDPPPQRAIEEKRSEERGRFADTALVKEGLSTLPPGKTVRAFFDSAIERKDSGLPDSYSVTVTYTDSAGRGMPPDHYVLDFKALWGIEFVDRKGLHELAESMENLHKEVKKWTHGTSGLHVVTAGERAYQRRLARWRGVRAPVPENASRAERQLRRFRIWVKQLLDRYGL